MRHLILLAAAAALLGSGVAADRILVDPPAPVKEPHTDHYCHTPATAELNWHAYNDTDQRVMNHRGGW